MTSFAISLGLVSTVTKAVGIGIGGIGIGTDTSGIGIGIGQAWYRYRYQLLYSIYLIVLLFDYENGLSSFPWDDKNQNYIY